MITKELYIVPIRIESESNKTEHWSKKHARHKRHRFAIKMMLNQSTIKPPCEVKLTRIAPRMLDSEDNLPAALKNAKDVCADLLIPGLAAGRADGSNLISWKFAQEKGTIRQYALKIELTKENGNDIPH